MTPNFPPMDYALIMTWFNAVLSQLWPLIAVLIGAVIGITVFKIYRRAISE